MLHPGQQRQPPAQDNEDVLIGLELDRRRRFYISDRRLCLGMVAVR